MLYLVGAPVVVVAILLELGLAALWLGFPLVYVNSLCSYNLSNYGLCGYYFDWFGFVLDAVFYTGWAYALLGSYKLLRDARGGPAVPKKPDAPT
jgi:hypothetical protein